MEGILFGHIALWCGLAAFAVILMRALVGARKKPLAAANTTAEQEQGVCASMPAVRLPDRAPPSGAAKRYDACLVDDDSLCRRLWAISAAQHGLRIVTFAAIDDFYAEAANIATDTPLYIDSELGCGVRGEVEAKKIAKDCGFTHIFLATGHPASRFKDMPWLSGVITKVPPWQTASVPQAHAARVIC